MAREDLHFRLRIPEDLKKRIEQAAIENHRSMTAEIVARLYDSMDLATLRATFADSDLALEHCDQIREVQAKYIEALAAENEALKKAGVAGEQIVYQLAYAISKAAAGDRTELDRLVEQERERPILKRLTTVWSVIDDGH